MIESFLRRLRGKESKATYIPKLEDIENEVGNLLTESIFDRSLQDRLLSLAGISSTSKFFMVKSEEYGGSVSIMTPDKAEPVLKISPGATQRSLIGINKLNNKLTYWDLPYKEIEGRQGLGDVVRKIVLGEAEVQVYDLSKRSVPKKPEIKKEVERDFGFVRRKEK